MHLRSLILPALALMIAPLSDAAAWGTREVYHETVVYERPVDRFRFSTGGLNISLNDYPPDYGYRRYVSYGHHDRYHDRRHWRKHHDRHHYRGHHRRHHRSHHRDCDD